MAYVKKIEAPLSVRQVHEEILTALNSGKKWNAVKFDLSRPQGRTRKITLFNTKTGEPAAILDYRVRTARQKKMPKRGTTKKTAR